MKAEEARQAIYEAVGPGFWFVRSQVPKLPHTSSISTALDTLMNRGDLERRTISRSDPRRQGRAGGGPKYEYRLIA